MFRKLIGFVASLIVLTHTVWILNCAHAQPAGQVCLSDASWSEPEKFTWEQLCKRGAVDYGQRSQSERTLSIEFLRTILTHPIYKAQARHVKISNAIFPIETNGKDSKISGADVESLELDDCSFNSLTLISANIRSLVFRDVAVTNNIIITGGTFSEIILAPRELSFFEVEDANIDTHLTIAGNIDGPFYWYASGKHIKISSMILTNTHVHDLWIDRDASIKLLSISRTNIDGEFRSDAPELGSLSLWGDKIGRNLSFDNAGSLGISDTTAGVVRLPRQPPHDIHVESFTFSNWSADLPATLEYIKRNRDYDPTLLDGISRSFQQRGDFTGARAVRYAKANLDYQHTSQPSRIPLFVSWLFVGYGLYPETGFLWLGLFVAIGFFVFRTGRLSDGNVPRSWFMYSLDMIVPVIHLDKKHDDIQFAGWRQYFVYVMRMLSAVLAFLVFKFIQNDITGG